MTLFNQTNLFFFLHFLENLLFIDDNEDEESKYPNFQIAKTQPWGVA